MCKKKVLTNSSMTSFSTCNKKYWWRNIREIVPVTTSEAMSLGTAVHSVVENFLSDDEVPLPSTNRLSARARGILEGAIDNYPYIYARDKELYDVVSLEEVLWSKIKNPATNRSSRKFIYGGKLDGLLILKQEYEGYDEGSLILMETKTTARLDEAFIDQLKNSPQTTLYINSLADQGIKVDAILYNIIAKPCLRLRKDETEDEYSERVRLKMGDPELYRRILMAAPTEMEMKKVMANAWQVKDHIALAMNMNSFPMNKSACFNYNTKCQYYELCTSNDPELVINNLGIYKYKPANSELIEQEPEPVYAARNSQTSRDAAYGAF